MANGKHMFPGGPAANTQEGILEPHTREPGCKQTENRGNQEYTAPGEQDQEEV